jgi:hypothetical protein
MTTNNFHTYNYEDLRISEQVEQMVNRKQQQIANVCYKGNLKNEYNHKSRGQHNEADVYYILKNMGSEIISNDKNHYNLLSSKNVFNSLFYVAALALDNEENCRKLFQYVHPHLKETEIDDIKLFNKLPTLRDDNNLEYYSFLWRILISKNLPIEIFDQTRKLISSKTYSLTKFNQHFGSSNGQTRSPEFEQIIQKSTSDLRLDKQRSGTFYKLLL